MTNLHIDIETYSSVDIKTCGAYKYAESIDFEILIVAFGNGDNPPVVYEYDELPDYFFDMLLDPKIMKHAHNANFERVCFRAVGYDVPADQWRCSAVKASYCGLPMSLDAVSAALHLGDKGKSAAGKALIRYFSCPVKPTKTNGGRTRNYPEHNPEKWHEYKDYCRRDVVAEMEVEDKLKGYKMPDTEWAAYALDQKINDRGVLIDVQFATNALAFDAINASEINARIKTLTNLDNPNSPEQLCKWLSEQTKERVTSIAVAAVEVLLAGVLPAVVQEVLELRQKTGKTSIKKYAAMLAFAADDNRARGLFQFYGAGRTGRWAGRGVQLQNLRSNDMKDIDNAQELVASNDYDTASMVYDMSDTLSQLIRTALVPSEGSTFAVADFSAIEARVLSWLAKEQWRLDVFATHGKIYEASASRMFNTPLEQIGKGSPLRQRGKVAELALGYEGAVGALKTMGAESYGLDEMQMKLIVEKWRAANPRVVLLWREFNKLAVEAVTTKKAFTHPGTGIIFKGTNEALLVRLPSGRALVYWGAVIAKNKWDRPAVRYKGPDPKTKQWGWIDTYGGKLVENITQAIARDLLLHSLSLLNNEGFDIVAHVHDEAICEEPKEGERLARMIELMSDAPEWAEGLPLNADGYLCAFYKKD